MADNTPKYISRTAGLGDYLTLPRPLIQAQMSGLCHSDPEWISDIGLSKRNYRNSSFEKDEQNPCGGATGIYRNDSYLHRNSSFYSSCSSNSSTTTAAEDDQVPSPSSIAAPYRHCLYECLTVHQVCSLANWFCPILACVPLIHINCSPSFCRRLFLWLL